MENLFAALIVIFLFVLIVWVRRKQMVLFFLDKNKRNKQKLLIFIGIAICICFSIFKLSYNAKSVEIKVNANTDAVSEGQSKEENQEVSKIQNNEWKPQEVAKLNRPYYCYDDSMKYTDGRQLVINVLNISKKDDTINIISAAPPYDDIKYAKENYMKFKIIDEEGNEISAPVKDITLSIVKYEENGDIYANSTQISISGVDVEKVRWITIEPYETTDKNPVTFEIK